MSGIYRAKHGEITWQESVAISNDAYWEIGAGADEKLSIHFIWHDATTAGTVTVEGSNLPPDKAASDSTNLDDWDPLDSSMVTTISSPAGGAAGSTIFDVSTGARRVRVKFAASANSVVSIFVHGKE